MNFDRDTSFHKRAEELKAAIVSGDPIAAESIQNNLLSDVSGKRLNGDVDFVIREAMNELSVQLSGQIIFDDA